MTKFKLSNFVVEYALVIFEYAIIENIKWAFWEKSCTLGHACPQHLLASPRTGIHIANLMCTSAKM